MNARSKKQAVARQEEVISTSEAVEIIKYNQIQNTKADNDGIAYQALRGLLARADGPISALSDYVNWCNEQASPPLADKSTDRFPMTPVDEVFAGSSTSYITADYLEAIQASGLYTMLKKENKLNNLLALLVGYATYASEDYDEAISLCAGDWGVDQWSGFHSRLFDVSSGGYYVTAGDIQDVTTHDEKAKQGAKRADLTRLVNWNKIEGSWGSNVHGILNHVLEYDPEITKKEVETLVPLVLDYGFEPLARDVLDVYSGEITPDLRDEIYRKIRTTSGFHSPHKYMFLLDSNILPTDDHVDKVKKVLERSGYKDQYQSTLTAIDV